MDNSCAHRQERGRAMGKSVSINIPEDRITPGIIPREEH